MRLRGAVAVAAAALLAIPAVTSAATPRPAVDCRGAPACGLELRTAPIAVGRSRIRVRAHVYYDRNCAPVCEPLTGAAAQATLT